MTGQFTSIFLTCHGLFNPFAASGKTACQSDNVGNIALLQRAEVAGLLSKDVGVKASAAYRELRRVQHKARLNEAPTQVPKAELQEERGAILSLWQAVFLEAAKGLNSP